MTDRDATIKTIKAALKARSGKTWSVTGGRGTAYGWIEINVPPARRAFAWDGVTPEANGYASLAERQELATLLGLDAPIHPQGHNIAASSAYRTEYLERAQGQTPAVIATPYWD